MKHAALFLLVALFNCVCALAQGYYGTPYNFSQPNGDSVTVKLYGSDYFLHAESIDGYTVIVDPDDGYICYALISSDSLDYASTGIRYTGGAVPKAVTMIVNPHVRISSRGISKKISETKTVLGLQDKTGQNKKTLRSATVMPDTIYGVTVLIDFPDCKFPFTPTEIDTFLNANKGSINGNAMSIKKYFQWISNGKLTYINRVPKEPFTAPNNKSYYAPAEATSYTIKRLEPVIADALNSYSKEKDGFDLKDITTRPNGHSLYGLNILYAGDCPNKWATGLWPHKGEMYLKFNYLDNASVGNQYQITYCSSNLSMTSFVHENLHLLIDADDFYSFDNHTGNNAEEFNVSEEFFRRNDKNTPFPNPWTLDRAGWLNNKIVLNDLEDGTKVNLDYGPGNVAVYQDNINFKIEYYYLEIRNFYYKNKVKINSPGIFIWHVYVAGDNRYENCTDKLDCRPASSSNPFWTNKSPSKVFSDDSEPSANWNDKRKSGIYLCNFSAGGEHMSFCYGPCDDDSEEQEENNENESLEDTISNNGTTIYDKLDLVNRDSLPNGRVGEEYYAKLYGVGGDGNYSIVWKDGLPAGLSLNSDLEIVGIPQKSGVKMLKMYVCDGTGAKTEVWLKLTIKPNEATISNALSANRDFSIAYENGTFVIKSCRDNAKVRVYSINGFEKETILNRDSVFKFGSDCEKGIYIVEFDGKRYKIVK